MSTARELVQGARALVFDFDGTLADSNSIKARAFAICFEEFPKQREDILAYCLNNHHTPRGEKFQYVYERILDTPYTPAIARSLHERFAAVTTRQIVEAPEIPGAIQFLRERARSHETALLSSTPHDTLMEILSERAWVAYFARIQGAPVNKASWLSAFRAERGWRAVELVFFGDTLEDARAAKAAGCAFIAVANPTIHREADGVVPNFTELLLS